MGAIAALVTAGAGYVLVERIRAREVDSVELVESTEMLTRLFEERHRGAGEPSTPPAEGVPYPPPLVRESLPEDDVGAFYPSLGRGYVYDEHLWVRRKGGGGKWIKFREHPDGRYRFETNSLGFRMDRDVREEQPDLRVLVVGDSHTAGVCNYGENYTALLEAGLAARYPDRSVEVVNAAVGGYNTYNYLLVLEEFLELRPDVYVVTLYGGNDFDATAQLGRYFERMPSPRTRPIRSRDVSRLKQGLGAQEMSQVAYFVNNPKDEGLAARLTASITAEIQRLCEREGIELLGAFLPPATRAQPALVDARLRTELRALADLGLQEEELDVSVRLGASWLGFLRERGLPHVDLGPVLGASDQLAFWETDMHLNVHGHALVAAALLPEVVGLVDGR